MSRITPPATIGTRGWPRICVVISVPRSALVADRVTRIPVAVEMSRAGICAARPSPTVSSEYVWMAVPNEMWCWITPTTIPPSRLIATITSPAVASPFTNFEAPSIAP